MSSEIAISLKDVSKSYHIYERPSDRLLQFVVPPLRRLVGQHGSRLLPAAWRRDAFHTQFNAVSDISLDVRKGEAVGIVGMNGAGKSTLLQLIAGIIAPTAGSVKVSGRMAGLFELGSGFNPDFTGRENVFLNGAILGFSRAEIQERLDGILEFAAIGDFVDQPVKTYSTGMLVRLAFAVQVQLEPDILIVDEALAVGDALFQKRCYARIEKFMASGGTLLFVSHDQETVRTLTDRAILLRSGKIERIGASSEVVLEYRRLLHEEENAYAKTLLDNLAGRAADAASEDVGDEGKANRSGRSSTMAFGDMDVEIVATAIRDGGGNLCDLFYPGDTIVLGIECLVRHDVTNLNLGVRIRNKEGVKIYSGGTFNQDLSAGDTSDTVWSRRFRSGDRLIFTMRFDCNLGEGFYEIQPYVTEEQAFSPGHQRTLHWVDEAAFFRVSMNRFVRWYGGVTDIAPSCELEVA